ncbi:MAG: beta-ketoacyl-ACP synthase III [Myxococcales bacterium]|nr:beta-ketoacyl-ACP synthase III [Myxococcales bacterium]
MDRILITGTGLYTPPHRISNADLVSSLAEATETWNRENAAAIERGDVEVRDLPSERFIVKASGVEHRYVIDRDGVLDPTRLRPRLPLRDEGELSIQAEICLEAIHQALAQAGREPREVDALIVGCSNLQRAYPAVAVEVQDALGAGGFAFDMNVACSTATFAMSAAIDALRAGNARCAVVVNPEITSGHNNFELRDFHFIFGDACTATVLERQQQAAPGEAWEVLGTRLATKFSNNIRNDAGFLNRCEDGERHPHELVFRQQGRKVFREVCPLVAEHMLGHLADLKLTPGDLRRMWLHQANLAMNQFIAKAVLGRPAHAHEAPVILDEYANTSSAGSVIAFHLHRDDLGEGDVGMLCSFGAGYSIGSIGLRKFSD